MSEAVSERDNLPNGWINLELQNCVEILDSKRIPVNTSQREQRRGVVPYYGSTGQVGWIDDYLFDEELVLLGEDGAPFFDNFKDTAYLISGKSWVNNHAHVLKGIKNLLLNKFLCHFLNQFDYHEYVTGTTRLKLNQTRMKVIPVLLPPLAEQKRIVAKIESIFAQIDTKQQELEKLALQIRFVPDSFTELKGSILKKAFEGKLVPQDPDDEPVEAILKRIRRASEKELIFEKYDSPSGWIRVLLSDIAQINPPKPEKNSISDRLEVSFVPMRNVEALNGKIDLSETREYAKVRTGYTYFQNDDIIFAKITPCMENGKIAIVTGLKNGIGFGSTEFHVIRLKDEMLRKFYFLYFIQSDFRYSAQHKMKGTAGQLRVPSDYMKNILVPLPPLNEQKRIVAKIQSIFAQIDTKQQELEKLASQIRSVPDSFAELKGSILKKTFGGRLVPQDPHDEPASVLLERIK